MRVYNIVPRVCNERPSMTRGEYYYVQYTEKGSNARTARRGERAVAKRAKGSIYVRMPRKTRHNHWHGCTPRADTREGAIRDT